MSKNNYDPEALSTYWDIMMEKFDSSSDEEWENSINVLLEEKKNYFKELAKKFPQDEKTTEKLIEINELIKINEMLFMNMQIFKAKNSLK